MSIKDITERKQQDEEIQAFQPTTISQPGCQIDPLYRTVCALAITARRHQYIGALLFIDLDDF